MFNTLKCTAMGWTSLSMLLLACDGAGPTTVTQAELSQATSTWTRSSFFQDATGFVPCLGEDVHFYGEVPYIFHEVNTPSGGYQYFYQFRPVTPSSPFFARGLSSGTLYQYQNGHPINEEFHAGPGQTFSRQDREVYVNVANNQDRFSIEVLQHMTVNANGTLTVDRTDFSGWVCDGQ